jgi:hypothetical protein
MPTISQTQFKALVKRASEEEDYQLTLEDIGDVFGKDFYIMVITLLLDAQDSARAIQGAIRRLSTATPVSPVLDSNEDEDVDF